MSDFYEGRPQERRPVPGNRRDDYDDDPYPSRHDADYFDENLPHSGPGIASFLFTLLAFAFAAIFIGIAVANPNADFEFEVENMTRMGASMLLSMLAAAGCSFIGVILGIVGCSQKRRKKIFAVLGLVFCGLGVLSFCGFLGLGLMVAG